MTESERWGDLLVAGTDRRREIRRRHGNGVDAVEVREHGRRLAVTFLEQVPPGLTPANIRIEAPARGRPVTVGAVWLAGEDEPELQGRLIIELDRRGSEGIYRLRVVQRGPEGRPGWAPFRGIDPRFAAARFSFYPDAPGLVISSPPAAPASAGPDQSSYLARDFDALCLMLLDRLTVTIPEWTERHIPDIGITLVELLAYEGDDLGYYQDAVGTETYLQTARQRISVRRHARLVGYRLHEGCNARAWVCLEVDTDMDLPLAAVGFATLGEATAGATPVMELAALSSAGAIQFFVPLPAGFSGPDEQATMPLHVAHNEIALWNWGERDSWLVAGATSAVLMDEWTEPPSGRRPRARRLRLQRGDVLMLEEILDPSGTGPADPSHRHAVRITDVEQHVDELYDQPIVTVTWADEDALPFALRVSAPGAAEESIACTTARANVVLVDHGLEVTERVPTARSVLSQPGLSYGCPFPDPVLVRRSQARRLRDLFRAWRRQVDRWRRTAEEGTPLTEHQLAELSSLLGEEELERLHLTRRGDDERSGREGGPRAEQEARALTGLLVHADRLLADRLRRVDVLARLADASGPLESVYTDELAEDWGQELTFPLDPARPASWGPAAAINQDPVAALPLLRLTEVPVTGAEDPGPATWTPVLDLLESSPGSRDVVVEVDDDGIGHLRFPSDAPLPPSGAFTAHYRVGNPVDGNVPAESINTVVWLGTDVAPAASAPPQKGSRGTRGRRRPARAAGDQASQSAATLASIVGVRNPLGAAGGTARETVQAAKQAVPGAYLTGQPRAMSAPDYAALASNVPGVLRAAAQLCWTGARVAAEVAVQPSTGETPSSQLLGEVRSVLWLARRIGHDLWVHAPRYLPLLVGIDAQVAATASRADLAADLRQRISNGWLPDGTPALFNPERLGFGMPVYASAIIAAVQAAPGVLSATITLLGFADDPAASEPELPANVPDRLDIGPMDIARLDNDPMAPQNGWATITLAGGR